MVEKALLQLNPADLGVLDLGGQWVTYADLVDEAFLPARIQIGGDEYAYASSIIILGHGAVLPQKVRELREAGKKVAIVEHEDRYVLFVSV